LVPSPWADPDVVPKTKAIMEKLGQVPVILKKEIDGFVLNRIQYAIFKESWRLIKVSLYNFS
jgi:L-gulonate 3-dehydrogenase